MLEILVQKEKEKTKIALVQNGNLIEYYEEEDEDNRKEGNIYLGKIKDIIGGMQSAFVDIGTDRNAFIHIEDLLPQKDIKNLATDKVNKSSSKISNIVKVGDSVLVQIKKDSNEQKGARVSTHVNLPGRYVALLPNTDIVTVSQKIEDVEEQKRLIKIAKCCLSKNNGVIIRTSSKGKEKEIIEDIKILEEKWKEIENRYNNLKGKSAQLLYASETIVEKMLIDLMSKGVSRVVVNSEDEYKKIKNYVGQILKNDDVKVELEKDFKIFNIYDIEHQVEKMQKRKVWLKCGGFITIDKTEALTAIDVNTGKFTGNKDLEQTIFIVNKEATLEIAKQIRLRDIGGIIIIDYIDMKNENNKKSIQNLLQEKLKEDRSKTQVEGFTRLDLMELTRKHICSHSSEISLSSN